MIHEQPGRTTRRWRITVLTTFPKTVLSELSNGLPAQLNFGTRIAESASQIGEVLVRLGPAGRDTQGLGQLDFRDAAKLTYELDAPSPIEAVEFAASAIDLVVDDLSFQLQEPLPLHSMRVLDITPPLHVGSEREFMQYSGYDQYKLSRSTSMGSTQTVLVPALRANYVQFSRRTQDALDWYIKSMHTPWDADQYIFLWVCFEILRNDFGEKIEEPTKLRCGHEIQKCPECQKPTRQIRQAASSYRFIEGFGIERNIAKDLWDMRQLVHGAKSFTPEQLERLGELLQILRAITAAALRAAMGIPDDAPPFVGYGAPAVGAVAGVGGTTMITEADLI